MYSPSSWGIVLKPTLKQSVHFQRYLHKENLKYPLGKVTIPWMIGMGCWRNISIPSRKT